jgi:hypothetical protein
VPIATTVGEHLSFFEKRAYGYLADVPDAVLREVVERVKSSIDGSKKSATAG